MKKSILYTIGAIGAVLAGWSAAITVNVAPITKPHRTYKKRRACTPGKIIHRGNRRYYCTPKGKWLRSGVRAPDVHVPKVKIHKPKISY